MPARKKAVNGSGKGAAFERLVAKQFSLWVSAGANADLLWRSAGSGGRSTQRRKATGRGIEYHASDIAPLHPDAAPFVDVFTLECKSYRSIELRQVVYDWPKSTIAKWWGQACRDARSVSRVPLMVVKENQKPALLIVPEPRGLYTLPLDEYVTAAVLPRASGIRMMLLADVLGIVPFDVFRKMYVPSDSVNRLALDRQPLRRVPLVDL